MPLKTKIDQWDTAENAALYQDFSQKYEYYKKAGEALAGAAKILPEHRVVDFGCGVGVSTRSLIRYLGEKGRIVGIDPAGAMIDCAKNQKWPAEVSFFKGDLKTLSALAPDSGFNRILCSSAVWLVSGIAPLAASIYRVLAGGGLFAFTIPAEFFGESSHLAQKNAARFWQAFLRVRESLGLEPPQPRSVDPGQFSLSMWQSVLQEAGFKKIDTTRFDYELTHEEWLAHISIPAILQNYLPAASETQKAEFLRVLKTQINPELESERRWIILTATK